MPCQNQMENVIFFTLICKVQGKHGQYQSKIRGQPPAIEEQAGFEKDMLGVIDNLKFRKIKSNFQKQLSTELRKIIKKTPKILVKGEKTRNILNKAEGLRENIKEVAEFYNKAPAFFIESIN